MTNRGEPGLQVYQLNQNWLLEQAIERRLDVARLSTYPASQIYDNMSRNATVYLPDS